MRQAVQACALPRTCGRRSRPDCAAQRRSRSRPSTRAYTQLDLDKCRHTQGREVEDYGSWRCAGYGGIAVRAQRRRSAHVRQLRPQRRARAVRRGETFPRFNSAYKGPSNGASRRRPDGKPRAVRHHPALERHSSRTTSATRTRPVLVVTRLGPGGVCHVGYVDARANPNANELAQQLADEQARTFKCGTDKPVVAGKVSPGLFMPGRTAHSNRQKDARTGVRASRRQARSAEFRSAVPGVGNLVETAFAEPLRGAGHGLAAECAIELHRRIVVGQRPDHQALQAALAEVAARRGEQAAAEAEALILGAQIKLVDLAVVEQAARAVAAVVGVARDLVAERQQRDAAALADRAVPPVGTAARDQLVEFDSGDDALIGGAPSLVVSLRDRQPRRTALRGEFR